MIPLLLGFLMRSVSRSRLKKNSGAGARAGSPALEGRKVAE